MDLLLNKRKTKTTIFYIYKYGDIIFQTPEDKIPCALNTQICPGFDLYMKQNNNFTKLNVLALFQKS